MTTAKQPAPDAVTTRTFRNSTLIGPQRLVRDATDEEINAALARMAAVGHVRRTALVDEIGVRHRERTGTPRHPSAIPMTVIALKYLELAPVGATFCGYAREQGVTLINNGAIGRDGSN